MAYEIDAVEASITSDPEGFYLCSWSLGNRWSGSRNIKRSLDLSTKNRTTETKLEFGSWYILFGPLIQWSEE